MKLIHCSDLHLDSRMETNLDDHRARERNNEISITFLRMIDYAKEQGVRAILIAGDLFDTDRISSVTADLVLDAMSQAPEVGFFYLRGNHDESKRVFAGRTLPENLYLFSEDWTYYRMENVVLAGVEPVEGEWDNFYDGLSLRQEDINLVMLHGQVSTQPGEEQICLPHLRDRNIDYLALGHLHSYRRETLDRRGTWCYSGCLEGRGFDECGKKGFVLLETGETGVRSQFIPFAKRTLHEVPADLTELTTVSEIAGAMAEAAQGIPSDDLVKFTLTGTYTLQTQKDLNHLRSRFASRFYAVKLKDQSRLAMERADYENDISLKGEFIRLVMASDLSEAEKEQIICAGMQALSGEEIAL